MVPISGALAQDFERIAPKPPPPLEGEPPEVRDDAAGESTTAVDVEGDGRSEPTVQEPDATHTSDEDSGTEDNAAAEEEKPLSDEPLIDELVGLVFINSNEALQVEGYPIEPQGAENWPVRILDLPKIDKPEFRALMQPFIGRYASIKSLTEMTNVIVRYYREMDRPVVNVFLPQQDITNGVIQVVVLEGRVGQVRVEGNKWFPTKRFVSSIRLRPGEEIKGHLVKSDLKWVNDNPFRRVDLVYEKGEVEGETDMVLRVEDRFPVRFFAGFENSGNDLTADERWYAGLNWGDVFGLDHQFSYQFTTSPDLEMFRAHSASYLIPLPWRHKLTFFGSYGETVGDLNLGDEESALGGVSSQVSFRYIIPLPSDDDRFEHSVQFGFDYKSTNNNLEFGGTEVFDTTTEVNQFVLAYQLSYRDDWGSTSFGGSIYYSPGNITSESDDDNYRAAREAADATYFYSNFRVTRLTRLPYDFTWSIRGLAQFSDANLLTTEQFGLGGYNNVRGYDEREVNMDEGFFLSSEFRTPPVSLFQIFGGKEAKDQLQFLAFVDYGGGKVRHQTANTPDRSTSLLSVGPGFRYAINPYFSLRFDYGFQLNDTGFNDRNDSRAHFGAMLSY